jgi:mannose-6-phosphate isomerase-like protein (cupin superfamily)
VARRVEKPWGHEEIWAENDRYAGKILFVRAGHRLSLQYHQKKDESIYLLRGRLRVTLENGDGELEVRDLEPGETRDVPAGRRHRFEAIEDCEILEVSSPELDDVVRIDDDYERPETGSSARPRRT